MAEIRVMTWKHDIDGGPDYPGKLTAFFKQEVIADSPVESRVLYIMFPHDTLRIFPMTDEQIKAFVSSLLSLLPSSPIPDSTERREG